VRNGQVLFSRGLKSSQTSSLTRDSGQSESDSFSGSNANELVVSVNNGFEHGFYRSRFGSRRCRVFRRHSFNADGADNLGRNFRHPFPFIPVSCSTGDSRCNRSQLCDVARLIGQTIGMCQPRRAEPILLGSSKAWTQANERSPSYSGHSSSLQM